MNVALFIGLAVIGAAPSATAQGEEIELLSPTRQSLRRVQNAWQRWVKAYYASDRHAADVAIEESLTICNYLGMERLPDLSLAAGVYAVRSAAAGDPAMANWALLAARRFDPQRPETEFAAAEVARHENHFLDAALGLGRGYFRLLRQPSSRRLWFSNGLLFILYVLLVSGGLFIALQMFSKGQALMADLQQRFLPADWPVVALWLVPIPMLLWPLVLPNGLLWLLLYWSLLLWGYLSSSERWVLSAVWLLAGLMPVVLPLQQRIVQRQLSPSVRLLDSLAEGSLYGDLFIDLEALKTVLPESLAVDELRADLYRRLGQWEHAKALYQRLTEAEPDNASVLINLAVYAHRERDFSQAIQLNQAATEIDSSLAEGFYNLNQAYAQTYEFSRSNLSLAQARALDSDRVSSWIEDESRREKPVPVDGSLQRAPEIRQALDSYWDTQNPTFARWTDWRSWQSLVAFLVLMVGGRWLRRLLRDGAGRRYSRAAPAPHAAWLRALLPGAVAAEDGHGTRAFLALVIPVVCLMIPLLRRIGWRLPLGYEPAGWLLVIFAAAALAILWLIRLRIELAD